MGDITCIVCAVKPTCRADAGGGWREAAGAAADGGAVGAGEQVIPELERAEDEEDRDDGWYVEVRCTERGLEP